MGPVQRQEYLYYTPQVRLFYLFALLWYLLCVSGRVALKTISARNCTSRSESRMRSTRMGSRFRICPFRMSFLFLLFVFCFSRGTEINVAIGAPLCIRGIKKLLFIVVRLG